MRKREEVERDLDSLRKMLLRRPRTMKELRTHFKRTRVTITEWLNHVGAKNCRKDQCSTALVWYLGRKTKNDSDSV